MPRLLTQVLSDELADMNKSESFFLSLLPFYPSWKPDFKPEFKKTWMSFCYLLHLFPSRCVKGFDYWM
jgi:hypothetical protein